MRTIDLRGSKWVTLFALCGVVGMTAAGCGTQSGSTEDGKASANEAQAQRAKEVGDIDPELAKAGLTAEDLAGPGEPTADRFNPDKHAVKPALGGRVIQHIASEPPNLNFAIENSAVIRWLHFDIHAGLVEFDPATWQMEPVLAESYDLEDTIILNPGAATAARHDLHVVLDDADATRGIVYGKVTEQGDDYLVSSGSSYNDAAEVRVPKSDVESVQMGTVFTFKLRENVFWHDGESYDAEDAYFSWDIYRNQQVDCDEKRYVFDDIVHSEVINPHVIRFFYRQQHFQALSTFGLTFCQLPSHLYNLHDKTNKDYDANATDEEMGAYINDNPHNLDWVGLGPYKLTAWERGQYLEAEKFDKFWNQDPEYSGYVDVLRWRHIDDDNLAFQGLLNGEVDIFDRVKSEDFMGAATKQATFTDNYYKAFTYVGSIGYTAWNVMEPKFSDVRVRTALAHAFDVKDWIRTNYEGLALVATFSMFRLGPGYNRDVECYPYDVEEAQKLLTDAGWYDRDGNGIVDKDGEDLVIEALMPSGNKASEKFLQKLQESYEKVGVKVDIVPFEWATFLERILDRDFDSCNLAWTLTDVESDPYGSWHGNEADPTRRTSNISGLNDPQVNDLIERGRTELDPEKRHAIWMELHARVYELQPFLFGWNVPRKIAFSKQLRGVKLYKFTPGYRLRDMYYEEGTEGTRPIPGA